MRKDNQDLLQLPLDEILLNFGYHIKKDKTTKRYAVLKNENDDMVVISRQANGHYLYFNPNDDSDRGNIFNFCKNRGLKTDDLIANKTEIKIKPIDKDLTNISQIKSIENYNKMQTIKNPNFLNTQRFINENITSKFTAIKTDEYFNANFPSYEISSNNILTKCGYVSYLRYPIKKEDKSIKQLCYGKKGLEIISQAKSFDNVKNIIICESSIDSLSLAEIKNFNLENTLICSTNGQICESQKEIFSLFSNKQAEIFLGFDNDEKGKAFTQTTLQYLPNANIVKPVLKDFNDDLMVGKLLGLQNNFTKKELKSTLLNFSNDTQKFVRLIDALYPCQRESRIEKFLSSQMPTIFKVIKPKVENFFDTKPITEALKKLESRSICKNR